MEYATLGRAGLRVSRMGLGCGGHSRLGLATGGTFEEAERVVREALALGINFIDTAESYGTEDVVGRALVDTPREQVIVSTKAGVGWQGRKATGPEIIKRVHASLQRLRTEYVDVFHLHGVSREDYLYASQELLPALQDLKAAGKIRYIGITEAFISDTGHRMLSRALEDDCWDVVMVGFNLLNQSARSRVLAITQAQNVGTLCMFAVRRALSQPDALRELLRELVEQHLVDASQLPPQTAANSNADSDADSDTDASSDNPLGFLLEDGEAESIPEAAYRFCRWEPGIDVVLSGTGNVEHLKANAMALNLPPLSPATTERLKQLFARVDTVSGN